MRPEQYPPFGLIHLKQDGQEFHPLDPNTRFYFEEFSQVIEFFKGSANYHLPGQSLKKIELRRVNDYFHVTLRYNKDYWTAFKVTGPIPLSKYLEYKVED